LFFVSTLNYNPERVLIEICGKATPVHTYEVLREGCKVDAKVTTIFPTCETVFTGLCKKEAESNDKHAHVFDQIHSHYISQSKSEAANEHHIGDIESSGAYLFGSMLRTLTHLPQSTGTSTVV
jgi:hypothetical protein